MHDLKTRFERMASLTPQKVSYGNPFLREGSPTPLSQRQMRRGEGVERVMSPVKRGLYRKVSESSMGSGSMRRGEGVERVMSPVKRGLYRKVSENSMGSGSLKQFSPGPRTSHEIFSAMVELQEDLKKEPLPRKEIQKKLVKLSTEPNFPGPEDYKNLEKKVTLYFLRSKYQWVDFLQIKKQIRKSKKLILYFIEHSKNVDLVNFSSKLKRWED